MSIGLRVHILAGLRGLSAGFLVLAIRKGGLRHRQIGRVFVYAMVIMGLTGAAIAAVRRTEPVHIQGLEASGLLGAFTAYLVVTGLLTVRRSTPSYRKAEMGALVVAAAIGVLQLWLAFQGTRARQPAMIGVVEVTFGVLALLAAGADLRMLRGARPPSGRKRVTRHLWRMILALWIATFAFFPRLLKYLPASMGWVVLIPIGGVLLALAYWTLRARRGRQPFATAEPVPEHV